MGFTRNYATYPYQEKEIDPALLTFKEYADLANPSKKIHCEEAYDTNLKSLTSYISIEAFPKLINNITVKGIDFTIRTTQEKGKVPMIGVFLKEEPHSAVAVTLNEWGCLLVQVVEEYRNFGFGTLLVKLAREESPDLDSGGFTPQGFNNLKRVHDERVRDYLAKGYYSELVKKGLISREKVNQIVSELTPAKKYPQRNLNFKFEDTLVLTDSGKSFVLFYHPELLKIIEKDIYSVPQEHYWAKETIFGYTMLAQYPKTNVRVFANYGKNEAIKAKGIEYLLNGEIGSKIKVSDQEKRLVEKYLGDKVKTDDNFIWIEEPTLNIQREMSVEKKVREAIVEKIHPSDKFKLGEIKTLVHEFGEGVALEKIN